MGRKARNERRIIRYLVLNDRNQIVPIDVDEQDRIKDHRQLLLISPNQKQTRKRKTQKKAAPKKNSAENQENIEINESFTFSFDDCNLYENGMNDEIEDPSEIFFDQTYFDEFF